MSATISTRFLAPEARRILAGGGAQRNHRDQLRNSFPAPEGRRTEPCLSPLRGWEDVFDRVRWFLHRLISGVLPGQRTIPEARQFVSSCFGITSLASQFAQLLLHC